MKLEALEPGARFRDRRGRLLVLVRREFSTSRSCECALAEVIEVSPESRTPAPGIIIRYSLAVDVEPEETHS